MTTIAGIAFASPWLLAGLVALPVLWLLLRAVPPAPVRRAFPGVALLSGLEDDDSQSDRTPWWLMLLRMAGVAALIVGFAGPVLNPQDRTPGTGPLLVLLDGTWADARDWSRRMERVGEALAAARSDGRSVAVVSLTDLPKGALPFLDADRWRAKLPGIRPRPWEPDPESLRAWSRRLTGDFETLWVSDGLARAGRMELLSALKRHGKLRVFESPAPVVGLAPPVFEGGKVRLSAERSRPGAPARLQLEARGPDPAGTERVLARVPLVFDAGAVSARVELSLPAELRNRITRFSIAGQNSAAAVSLTDDTSKRRKVALVGGQVGREGLQLLSQSHFLRQALAPGADLIEGTLDDIVQAGPDVIVLIDVARLSPAQTRAVRAWVEKGGLLLRFAGPRLAASDVGRAREDALMPVRLRAGGRTIGGAMSWGEPKRLRAFAETSPFFGLEIPEDVEVRAQVLAEPDPTLSERVIAALADGTPLVTRKRLGQGQVVLFHVTANAQWSNLPLSGLFVRMLDRLAVSSPLARPDPTELAGSLWEPVRVLDGFGTLSQAEGLAGVDGERLVGAPLGPALPPGLYQGQDRRIARNVIAAGRRLEAARWPAWVPVEGLETARETLLKGPLLLLGLLFLALDILATLRLSGRISARLAQAAPGDAGRGAAAVLALALAPALWTLNPTPLRAQEQEDQLALAATNELVLAYVRTGDAQVDRTSEAGLRGLSDVLFARTTVEPAEPAGVDIETDELAFFPFLYWPVTATQPLPSGEAYARLNRYLRDGGMILFDTRDADLASAAGGSPNRRRLQQIALGLDVPPLEPVPSDHVLTRTFYLLQEFPGRYTSGKVWVEAAPPDARRAEGMPFRNLNDNVTPVVIGANDWAAAWAVDTSGRPLVPIGRGSAGDRQREFAYRFGVNLIMYALTGNYKSDQVHVPALLERLGE